MTSRPTAGIQRQPQRSLSGTGIVQRPVHQRSLSQQYSLSAPIRKPENLTDLALNGSENGRYGASRPGGSRLKVELSKGSMDAPVLVDTLKSASAAPTLEAIRGRPRLQFEADAQHFRVTHGSTHLSSIRGVENITTANPIPMPRRPVQSAPPFTRGERSPIAVAVKKEVRPKPYALEVPSAAPHFQLNGKRIKDFLDMLQF
jgi:mediator of RNA polymerase II transcription subunit 12, fungi type